MVNAIITSGSDEDSEGKQPLHWGHRYALLACGLSPSAMQQILGWIERLGPHREHHSLGEGFEFNPNMDAIKSSVGMVMLAFNAADAAAEEEARGYWAAVRHDVPRAAFAGALGAEGLASLEPFQPALPLIRITEAAPSKQARQLALVFLSFVGQGMIGIDACDWLTLFDSAREIAVAEWCGERDDSPDAAAEKARETGAAILPQGAAVVVSTPSCWTLGDAAELMIHRDGLVSWFKDNSDAAVPSLLIFSPVTEVY